MQTKQSFTCERAHVRGKKTKINTHTETHTLTNRHSHIQHGWLSAHCSGVHCPLVTSRCLCLSLDWNLVLVNICTSFFPPSCFFPLCSSEFHVTVWLHYHFDRTSTFGPTHDFKGWTHQIWMGFQMTAIRDSSGSFHFIPSFICLFICLMFLLWAAEKFPIPYI